MKSLEIVVTCRSRRGTQARHLVVPLNWVSAWDEVRVNFTADGTGPDVLLLLRGSGVAAIEVRGSDPIGAGKEEALRRLAVPWAESSADEILKWTPGDSLPVYRLEPEGWQCAFCRAKEHASGPRVPQAEVFEARLTELREQGLLRLLWVKEYDAVLGDRSWKLELHICDLIDELGVPLHRLLVNGEYDFVVAGVTAEELASGVEEARRRFKEGKRHWTESLAAVGIGVSEIESGWRTVAEDRFLYDDDVARRRLREELRWREGEPKVVAACRVLGVKATDGIRELKAARNKLAKRWHPDLAPVEDAEAFNAKMREINQAFDLLSALQSNPVP